MPQPAEPVLPPPTPDASAHSRELAEHIANTIVAEGEWIPFTRYMELALYAPGLGYYAAGARKFGSEGDFVTSPEISPMFAKCFALQAAQVLDLRRRPLRGIEGDGLAACALPPPRGEPGPARAPARAHRPALS